MSRVSEIATRHLANLTTRVTGKGGHDGNGTTYAVCQVADWEMRQLRDDYQALLDRLEACEGLLREGVKVTVWRSNKELAWISKVDALLGDGEGSK